MKLCEFKLVENEAEFEELIGEGRKIYCFDQDGSKVETLVFLQGECYIINALYRPYETLTEISNAISVFGNELIDPRGVRRDIEIIAIDLEDQVVRYKYTYKSEIGLRKSEASFPGLLANFRFKTGNTPCGIEIQQQNL